MAGSQNHCNVFENNLWARSTSSDVAADINRYKSYQALTTRTLSIVSSSISILWGLLGFYFLLAISPKKWVFRHQLISILIFYDFIKAIFLLMYPARVISKAAAYYDLDYCKVVGFFTAMSIEGSDIAILSFAIHLALLIYKPQAYVQNGINKEGGLYRVRHSFYVLAIILPALLGSLVFINPEGYVPLTNWCYIPSRPIWPRMALSWGPRYVIIISIFIIYACIYRHVTKQYLKLGASLASSQREGSEKTIMWKKFARILRFVFFFKIILSESADDGSVENKEKDGTDASSLSSGMKTTVVENVQSNLSNVRNGQQISVQKSIRRNNVEQFVQRKLQVERQMKSIFIYPVSYVLLWIAPLVVHGFDFRYGLDRPPIFWLTCIAAFMQPFNCTIDTIVFLARERPWRISVSKVGVSSADNNIYSRWTDYISFMPLFRKPGNENTSEPKDSNSNFTNLAFQDPHDFSNILSDYNGNNKKDDYSYNPSSGSSTNILRATLGDRLKRQGLRDHYNHLKNEKEQQTSDGVHEDENITFLDFLEAGPPGS
ncbi:uncharacterized protein PRCAT00002462001 [Priceomyces carsonii]|uniref:uncharacterized protein n=1 Tax=Priceomyces carsonii TaxID=28549 RepID=UPI002EDB52AE|nr:unnamed protein product [Priceomyces carsonii]